MNEDSRDSSNSSAACRIDDIQVTSCDCVPERIDELVLSVKNTLSTCKNLKSKVSESSISDEVEKCLTCWLSMIVPPQSGWLGVPGERMKTADGNSPATATAPPVNNGSTFSSSACEQATKIAKSKNFIFVFLSFLDPNHLTIISQLLRYFWQAFIKKTATLLNLSEKLKIKILQWSSDWEIVN